MEVLKVILVDDEMLIRKSLRMKIDSERLGLNIIAEFSNSKKALDKIRELEPDIVITDICMPGMDGIEFSGECIQIFPQIKVIILTGYDEFNYAMRSIKVGVADFLLKPVQAEALNAALQKIRKKIFEERSKKEERKKLEGQIKENIPVFREKYLNQMIKEKVNNDVFRQKLESYEIRLNPGDFSIQTAIIEIKPGKSSDEEYTDIILYIKARELIEKFFVSDDYMIFFRDELGRIVVVNNNTDIPFVECLDLFRKMIITRLKCYINIGISLKKEDYSKFGNAYREAIEALNFGIADGENCIICYSNIGNLDIEVSGEEEQIWKEIMSYVKNGAVEKIDKRLQELWKIYEKDNVNGIEKAKIRIGDIYSWCLKTTVSMKIDNYHGRLKGLDEVYEKAPDFAEMYLSAKNTLLSIAGEIARKNETEKGDLINSIQRYMKKIMNDPNLSMSDVAGHFYISSGYMGRLFKRFLGKTYGEYLSEIRLHKAKDLLLHTNLKAYEIGERIGITDAHYLSIWFKKMSGYSLSEFRKGKKSE